MPAIRFASQLASSPVTRYSPRAGRFAHTLLDSPRLSPAHLPGFYSPPVASERAGYFEPHRTTVLPELQGLGLGLDLPLFGAANGAYTLARQPSAAASYDSDASTIIAQLTPKARPARAFQKVSPMIRCSAPRNVRFDVPPSPLLTPLRKKYIGSPYPMKEAANFFAEASPLGSPTTPVARGRAGFFEGPPPQLVARSKRVAKHVLKAEIAEGTLSNHAEVYATLSRLALAQ